MEDNKRLEYIKNNYNILDDVTDEYETISLHDSQPILIKHKETGNEFISKYVLNRLTKIDPTNKKIYTQWLVNIVFGLIRKEEHRKLMRMLFEDGENIKESLLIFDKKKKTKLFKEQVSQIYSISHINDHCNINQYRTIDLLFDVVDPFIERDYSELVKVVKDAVTLKLGHIKYEDHRFLVYTPTCLKGSTIFHPYATWCTARPKNGMFDSYTNQKSPFGKSELLVFIDKENLTLFQIHFESRQVNKHNNNNTVDEFNKYFLLLSDGLAAYVEKYLIDLIKGCLTPHNLKTKFNLVSDLSELYASYLHKFGLLNSYINLLFKEKETLSLSGKICLNNIDLTALLKLQTVKLFSLKLKEFPLLRKKHNISILSLWGNDITYFPEDITPLKGLKTLNLKNNKIKTIPNNIGELDKSNGGTLIMLNIANNQLTETTKLELKSQLPNVLVIT